MAGEIVVFTTCAPGEAESLATQLVEERLVACVNVMPQITSIYRWKDELVKDAENLLVIKSHMRLWEPLQARIQELHSYDVPEIICLTIDSGHKPYLDWLNSQLSDLPTPAGKET
jgi:periplasmic divalent cation tolerance protein